MNSSNLPSRAIAVVGTDTGVGKTFAARALRDHARSLGLASEAVKPFASGAVDGRWSDLEILGAPRISPAGSGGAPALFNLPLSPYGAARRGEPPVDFARFDAYVDEAIARNDLTVVEGIGGVLVPLDGETTWLDWHEARAWPTVVVARAELGTINHSLLTFEAIAQREIASLAFILAATAPVSDRDARENAAIIAEFSGVACAGIVPYDSINPSGAWAVGIDWNFLETSHAR